MACGQRWDHVVALNIYFVDHREHEAVENLNSSTNEIIRDLSPVLQVRATRNETFGSVLQRAMMMMYQPSKCYGTGYSVNKVTYNGFPVDLTSSKHVAIGDVISDPRSSLLVLKGTLTQANCCCLNYCLISCCAGEPKYEGNRYAENVMKR